MKRKASLSLLTAALILSFSSCTVYHIPPVISSPESSVQSSQESIAEKSEESVQKSEEISETVVSQPSEDDKFFRQNGRITVFSRSIIK